MLKRKRISSILLALVMLFSVMVALPKQASAATDFDDVEAGDTFAPHIAYVTEKGAFKGDGNKFMPQDKIKRGQVAAVLARALDLDLDEASDFSDVSADHIFTKDIAAVAKAGIFDGEKDGTFKPEEFITRGQAAKVIAIAFDYDLVAGKALEFEDVKEGYIFKTYIDALTSNGVLSGFEGNFMPEANVTRGQFSKYIATPLGYVEPLNVVSVSAINNNFREGNALAAGMEITIDAKDAEQKVVNIIALDEVVVKVNGVTLINNLDYTLGVDTITINQDYLNDLEVGTYTVEITLDGVKVPNQTITVSILKEARLEIGFADVDLSATANQPITLEEYDAEGDEITASIDLTNAVVSVDGTRLTGANVTVVTSPASITIPAAFLDTLEEGNHTLRVTLKNGKSAEITFKVVDGESVDEVELTVVTGEYPVVGATAGDKVDFTLAVTDKNDASVALNADDIVVKVNGAVVTRYTDLTALPNITLKADYLNTLSLGEYEVVVEYDEVASKAVKFEIVAGAADATESIVTPETDADVTKVVAGSIGSVTFEYKDAEGNPIVGENVTLTVAGDASATIEYSLRSNVPSGTVHVDTTIGKIEPKTDENGKATVYFRTTDANVDELVITGTVGSVGLDAGKINVIPAAFDAAASSAAKGTGNIVLNVKDVYNNGIEDLKLKKTDVKVVTSNQYVKLAGVVDNTDGTYNVTVTNSSGENLTGIQVTIEVLGETVETLTIDVAADGTIS